MGVASLVSKLFLASDGRLRPILRAFLYLAFGLVLVGVAQDAAHRLSVGQDRRIGILVGYLLIDILLLLEAWLFLRVFDRRSFRSLGLWFYPRWGRESLLGILIGAALIAVVVGVLVLSRLVHYDGWGAGAGTFGFVLTGVVLLAAATFEELATRGYAFQRLMESITPLGAVLVFSGLFGAGHLGNPNVNWLALTNTVLAGVLLSVAYLKTRGLWLPIGLHWSWNFLMGPILSLPVSGIRVGTPLFQVNIVPPDWLSGGAYGPEGSLVLTVVCTAAIIWLARTEAGAPSPAMQETLKSSSPASV